MAVIKEVTSSEDYKIQIVTSSPDLFVYVTNHEHEAKDSDCIWFFDKSSADKKVKFVNHAADVKIQYVDIKSRAGWRNKSHKLQNRIR